MYKAWRIIRTLSAAAGLFMVIGSVGTMDYHVMELGENEPGGLWLYIIIGAAMMIPAYVHEIRKSCRGEEE